MDRVIWVAVATAVVFATACGGSCPQPAPCPQCPAYNPPPQPQARQEWVDLPIHILFANGSSELSRENQMILDEAVETVRTRTDVEQVEIRGHTDSRGNDQMNRQLSEARAETVKQYLITRGIPADRLVARGFSEDEPRTSNTGRIDRAQNRRVDFRALIRRLE